jgi:hypothetical protein
MAAECTGLGKTVIRDGVPPSLGLQALGGTAAAGV